MTSSRRSAIPQPDRGQPVDSLVVGTLVGPHGVTGEVKLRPLTEFPERLLKRKTLRLRFRDGEESEYRVVGTRIHHEMILVRLEGVEDRDAAEALRDVVAVVPVDEAAPLPPGRYYEHQLLGLRVLTPDGEELGTVTEIIPGPSNDVYVAGPYLIPATHDAVLRLDPAEGVLVVLSKAYLEVEESRLTR